MDARGRPETVTELYPSPWLKAEDLDGRAVTVTIKAVDLEDFRLPDGTHKPAAVLTFERASKRLILNKTMCRAILAIAGSERFIDWVGQRVTLAPATAPNGRPTIDIKRGDNGKE